MRWFASRPRDIGNQTRAVLSDAMRGDGARRGRGRVSRRAIRMRPATARSMRTGPIALAFIGDRDAVARLAAEVAALTHPHPDSVDACVLWSLAIEQAITSARPDEAFDWSAAIRAGLDHIDPTRHELWISRLDEATDRDPADFHRSNGWVVGAFQAAIAAITSTADDDTTCPVTTLPRRCGRQHGPAVTPTPSRPSPDHCSAPDGVPRPSRWHGAGASTAGAPTTRRRLGRPARSDGSPGSARRTPGLARVARHRPSMRLWHQGPLAASSSMARGSAITVGSAPRSTPARPWSCRCAAWASTTCPPPSSTTRSGSSTATWTTTRTSPTSCSTPRGRSVELVDAGEQVFVHCVHAEHRAPTMAAAYLITRGVDAGTAIRRGAPHSVAHLSRS